MKILGIEFYTGGSAILDLLRDGGLVQVPSGPGLADDLPTMPAYRRALVEADYVIPDSGLMVMVWNAFLAGSPNQKIARYSGLKLLRELLTRPEVRPEGATFWVMPNARELELTRDWLVGEGFDRLRDEDFYIAPYYRDKLGPDGSVEDPELLARVQAHGAKYVFVCVGSGVQEQLGWVLAKGLDHRPAILCTGAAISFLTGAQANIPPWADRYHLGWLLRILQDPRKYGQRYLRAVKLVPAMLRERLAN